MVVSTKVFCHGRLLANRCAAKLAAPDHQRVIQQASLLEIQNQPGCRLIDFVTAFRQSDIIPPV